MSFDLVRLRRALGFIALGGIVGNQLLVDGNALQKIQIWNSGFGQRPEWHMGIDYPKLFNPLFQLEAVDQWSILNHLLFWPGVVSVFGFVLLLVSVRSPRSASVASEPVFRPRAEWAYAAATPASTSTQMTQAELPPQIATRVDVNPSEPPQVVPAGPARKKRVGFFLAIFRGLRGMFTYRGRSSRAEWWYFLAFVLIASVAVFFLGFGAIVSDSLHCGQDGVQGQGADAVDQVSKACADRAIAASKSFAPQFVRVVATLLLPLAAVGVRRLHDTGRSGPRLLIALTGIGLLPLAFWLAQRGETGANRFGENPIE